MAVWSPQDGEQGLALRCLGCGPEEREGLLRLPVLQLQESSDLWEGTVPYGEQQGAFLLRTSPEHSL